jgi:hypothetical protein
MFAKAIIDFLNFGFDQDGGYLPPVPTRSRPKYALTAPSLKKPRNNRPFPMDKPRRPFNSL